MFTATVKIMRSYDYNHFEISLTSEAESLESVDDMRKCAARLADKAVEQYKNKMASLSVSRENVDNLRNQVKIIKENYPKSEWSPEQKATVKKLENHDFLMAHSYDYRDDWDDRFEDFHRA